MEIVKVTKDGVDARELYEFLGVHHRYRDWIKNTIRDYRFKEGEDFCTFFSESSGGRPSKEYTLSLDMAKELSMVAKTEKGRKARKYFIKCEKIARRTEAIMLAGIETRKTLTDKIKDSNENERMHGHAYSTYTKLAYKLCGIEFVKQENFRDTLTKEQLAKVENAEGMIKAMLDMGKEYQSIKGALSPIFDVEKIEK